MGDTKQIDDIVEALLTLARRRAGKDLAANYHDVMVEINYELGGIMDRYKEGEGDNIMERLKE